MQFIWKVIITLLLCDASYFNLLIEYKGFYFVADFVYTCKPNISDLMWALIQWSDVSKYIYFLKIGSIIFISTNINLSHIFSHNITDALIYTV